MTRPKGPYSLQPPVMSVQIESAMDIMIVRNTARRAAGLLGFTPAHQAQLASAAATLAELVLKTGELHVVHFSGVVNTNQKGVQISITMPWLSGVSSHNVLIALRSKLGDLVDEILIEGETPPTVIMIMWRSDSDTGDADEEIHG
ncbi:MAG: hypothetical protein HZC41_22025 [Chloroflexi bacterium]|nr:hypothetical protein [Chloroflexota bacterium]